jgi:hypothetical protein
MLWRKKTAEQEGIEGQVWIAGNLTIHITKVLNAEVAEKGDLEKTEGNLFNGGIDSALRSLAPFSIAGLMEFAILLIFPINRM